MSVRVGPPKSTYGDTVKDDWDEWTRHLDRYVAELRDAHLIPPINGVEVVERRHRPVLLIDVAVPADEALTDRIAAVLGRVPHDVRHTPHSAVGRRQGVDYG